MKFYVITNSHFWALLLYTIMASIILLLIAAPMYLNTNYQAYINLQKKKIRKEQMENKKSYAEYQIVLKDMYHKEKYNQLEHLIAPVLFFIQYGMYILILNIVNKPISFLCQLSKTDMANLSSVFENKSEMFMLSHIGDIPAKTLSVQGMQKLKDFAMNFTFMGESLSKKCIEFKSYGWVIPVIIISVVLINVIRNLVKNWDLIKRSFKDTSVAMQGWLIIIKNLAMLSIYIVVAFSFTSFLSLYIIEVMIISFIKSKAVGKFLPREKVVEIVHKYKKVQNS